MKLTLAWSLRPLSSRWLLVIGLLLALSRPALALPAGAEGKIDAATWARVEAGAVREVLVLYDDAAIDMEVRAHLSARGLDRADAAALALRATRYRELKARADAALSADDARVRRDYRHIPMRLVRPRDAAALARLLARPEVAAVMEDARAYPHLAQSLPLVGQPAVAQVMGRTGAGATVAVLDTGVDYTRAEFGACTAPGVPAGCRVVAAVDTATDDGARDANGHGTWVAGTVAGIAPGAGIAAIDVFDGTSAWSSDIIDGIDWAIDNRAAYNIVALNLSLGDGVKYTSPCNNRFANPYRQPFIDARAAGILPVVSSGNEGYGDGLASPACTPEAVSVGAVYDASVGSLTWGTTEPDCTDASTAADKVMCLSNSASFLTLLAPGALITVTGVTAGGTSLASPFVSGGLAVLAQAFPGDSITTRLARLTGNGVSVTDSRNGLAKPRLNLLAAQGAPANDAFASAATLGGLTGSATGWNLNAGKEASEPEHAGNAGGKSVWWQWTAPADGRLALDTHGSGFDTLLGVYTGAGVSALTAVAANDNDGGAGNSSGLSADVLAGTTYRVAVDGKAAASGAVSLGWSLRQAQSIQFDPIPDQQVNASLSLTASAGSGLPVAFASLTPAVCEVSGNLAELLAGGTCAVQASQAGDAAWLPAPAVTQGFTVNSLAQDIDFPVLADRALGDSPFALSVTASSGLPVELVSQTPDVCAVDGLQVSLLAAGTCGLEASQSGDAVWAPAAPVARRFQVLSQDGGAAGGDGDVPLPPWSLALLGAGLLAGMLGRGRR